MTVDAATYEQEQGQSPRPKRLPAVGGAGGNPSTWVGAYVLGSVLVLAGLCRSFRRFT